LYVYVFAPGDTIALSGISTTAHRSGYNDTSSLKPFYGWGWSLWLICLGPKLHTVLLYYLFYIITDLTFILDEGNTLHAWPIIPADFSSWGLCPYLLLDLPPPCYLTLIVYQWWHHLGNRWYRCHLYETLLFHLHVCNFLHILL
jgi:hypothetical protein